MDAPRRVKVILFVAASLIATLSGALVGALTREVPSAEATVREGCAGPSCLTPAPSPSDTPTLDLSGPCDEPEHVADPACVADLDEVFDEEDLDEDDGDNSGPGSDSSGPG